MQDIVKWLIHLEHLTGDLYRDAALFFQDDKELSSFLNRAAEDEALHFHFMCSAAEYLRSMTDTIRPAITLNNALKAEIEEPLAKGKDLLDSGKITRNDMLGYLIEIEFSELNDLFLYVVNLLKKRSREFQYIAARIEGHKKRLENFLLSISDGKKYLDTIKSLPNLWKNKILIVDDEPAIVYFLKALLEKDGPVETAGNGQEALQLTMRHYFDVIISDIGMPILNGIEFYKQASAKDSNIGKRFLFISGEPSPEDIDFITKNNLTYMIKPVPINKIEEAIHKIIGRTLTDD